jgi:hypothetical protein
MPGPIPAECGKHAVLGPKSPARWLRRSRSSALFCTGATG